MPEMSVNIPGLLDGKGFQFFQQWSIQYTSIKTLPSGTHECVPYEYTGRCPIHPTFVDPRKKKVVRKNDFYGYIDKTGKEIIPCQYKSASSFSEGLALVETADDQKFFIDKSGNPLQKKTFKGKISSLIDEMKHENHKKLIKTIDNIRINK